MVNEKVNLKNLRKACRDMIELIDAMSDPAADSSGVRNFGFGKVADEIRYELDGSESCVPAVRERSLNRLLSLRSRL